MKVPLRSRDEAIVNPLTIDISCSVCGREPSHPHIRYQFIYAAYHIRPSLLGVPPRAYIAALCAPCVESDRRAGVGTARNRFLALVRQWSGQAPNQEQIVRLLEHPTGVTGEEREGDSCFRGGGLHSFRALMAHQEAE